MKIAILSQEGSRLWNSSLENFFLIFFKKKTSKSEFGRVGMFNTSKTEAAVSLFTALAKHGQVDTYIHHSNV